MYATCETTDCPSAWQPVRVVGDVTVMCGVCGNPITDITATAPEPVKEMPTWV